jgi:hypothetical protein
MDLLLLADRTGILDMTHEAIARRLNVPVKIVRTEIGKLMQPDPLSRSKAEDGRRLIPLDDRGWGWQIVNFVNYHQMRDEEGRRTYRRDWMRRRRAEEKANKDKGNNGEPVNNHVNTREHSCTHVDVDVKKKNAAGKPPLRISLKARRTHPDAKAFLESWDREHQKVFGVAYARTAWDKEMIQATAILKARDLAALPPLINTFLQSNGQTAKTVGAFLSFGLNWAEQHQAKSAPEQVTGRRFQ